VVDECLQQEMGEPPTDVCPVRRMVQFLPTAQDAQDDASGCGGIGERSVVRGTALEGIGEDMTITDKPKSYLGIGSCCLFAIATSCLIVLIVANWNAHYKMAGLEVVVVGPAAMALYGLGTIMGWAGMRRPSDNPFSKLGCILNVAPFAILWLFLAFAIIH
jgi:hypothetical protein